MSDQLADQQQLAKVSLFELSTHEENVALFCTWLQDAETKMKRDSDLQPTLQAKKTLLQNIKVSNALLTFLIISVSYNNNKRSFERHFLRNKGLGFFCNEEKPFTDFNIDISIVLHRTYIPILSSIVICC